MKREATNVEIINRSHVRLGSTALSAVDLSAVLTSFIVGVFVSCSAEMWAATWSLYTIKVNDGLTSWPKQNVEGCYRYWFCVFRVVFNVVNIHCCNFNSHQRHYVRKKRRSNFEKEMSYVQKTCPMFQQKGILCPQTEKSHIWAQKCPKSKDWKVITCRTEFSYVRQHNDFHPQTEILNVR